MRSNDPEALRRREPHPILTDDGEVIAPVPELEAEGFTEFRIMFERYYPVAHKLETRNQRRSWFESYREFRTMYDAARATRARPTPHQIMVAFSNYLGTRAASEMKVQGSAISYATEWIHWLNWAIQDGLTRAIAADGGLLGDEMKDLLRRELADSRDAPGTQRLTLDTSVQDIIRRGIETACKAPRGDDAAAYAAARDGVRVSLAAAREMQDRWRVIDTAQDVLAAVIVTPARAIALQPHVLAVLAKALGGQPPRKVVPMQVVDAILAARMNQARAEAAVRDGVDHALLAARGIRTRARGDGGEIAMEETVDLSTL